MTRRRAEALALTSTSSASQDATALLQRINDGLEIDPVIIFEEEQSQLETTEHGNVVLELGDEYLDSVKLESMLESSNQGQPQATLNQGNRHTTRGTPALYLEPAQDTQDEHNFYSGINEPNLDYEDTDNDEPTEIQIRLAEHQGSMQQVADQYEANYAREETLAEMLDKYTYFNADFTTIEEDSIFDF